MTTYQHDRLKPVLPDEVFATRFADTHPYGFYMRRSDAEDVQRIINDEERWVVLNINPQSLSWREPLATAITTTQGGGKVIESRGGVLRYGQISGTTGYLPKSDAKQNSPLSTLTDDDPDLDIKLGRISGYYRFHRLRHLFRLFAWERRRGNINVTLHYMDYKSEEFWRIEPQEFALQRSAKQPYTYSYNISFTAIERSDIVDVSIVDSFVQRVVDLNLTPETVQLPHLNKPLARSIDRLAELRRNGLGFVQRTAGSIQRHFQNALRNIARVLQLFADVLAAFDTVLNLPIVLLTQTRGSVDALFDTLARFDDDAIALELNDWGLEVIGILDDIQSRFASIINPDVVATDRDYAQGKGKQGVNSDFMPEASGNAGSPDANPYIGSSGLGITTDYNALLRNTPMQAAPIYTGDTIWTLAQRLLGNVQRFVDLILWNNLTHPYIVSDVLNKPPNTLAWGETILTRSTDAAALIDSTATATLVSSYTGTCTDTGTGVELIDARLDMVPWRTNQWAGYTITLRPGTPTEELRIIVTNNDAVLFVNYAWVIPPAVADEYTLTLNLFTSGKPVTAEARAYGRDVLAVFKHDGATFARRSCTLVFNTRGDIATVQGEANLMQAVQLRGNTEINTHPFHPTFGIAMPVGRPWSLSNSLLYAYYIRQSFLQDPRIAAVRKAQLVLDSSRGDVLRFSAEIQPKQARRARALTVISSSR